MPNGWFVRNNQVLKNSENLALLDAITVTISSGPPVPPAPPVSGFGGYINAAGIDGIVSLGVSLSSEDLIFIDFDSTAAASVGVQSIVGDPERNYLYIADRDNGMRYYSPTAGVFGAEVGSYSDATIQAQDITVYPSSSSTGTFLFMTNRTNGLCAGYIDASEVLTWQDGHIQNPGTADYVGCWSELNNPPINQQYIYVGDKYVGVHVYTTTPGNILYYISTYTVLEAGVEKAAGVWGDGTFVYLAGEETGIHCFTNNIGTLTRNSRDDQGGQAKNVWGDGNYIYLANDTRGIDVYSVDGAGVLTWVSNANSAANAYDVWGDGNYIYAATSAGVKSYTVDAFGTLTLKSTMFSTSSFNTVGGI